VRTDRVRTSKKQVCEKWTRTILHFAAKIPCSSKFFPCYFSQEIAREVTAAQRFLDTKSALRAPKLRNSLLNSLLAGNLRGDGCDQHCVASQPVRRSEKLPLILAERPANGGLLHICGQSPDSDFGHSQSKIADSLRRTLGKFPFLGDCGRRPGSICTAWPSLQCNSPKFSRGPRANWGMPRSHFHETVRRQDGQRE
jgi:hypothetical protein